MLHMLLHSPHGSCTCPMHCSRIALSGLSLHLSGCHMQTAEDLHFYYRNTTLPLYVGIGLQAADRSLANLVLAKGAAYHGRHSPSRAGPKAVLKSPAHPSKRPISASHPTSPQPTSPRRPASSRGAAAHWNSNLQPSQAAGTLASPLGSPMLAGPMLHGASVAHSSSPLQQQDKLVPAAQHAGLGEADTYQDDEDLASGGSVGEGRQSSMRAAAAEGAAEAGTPTALASSAGLGHWAVRGDALVAPTPEQLGALRRHLKARALMTSADAGSR